MCERNGNVHRTQNLKLSAMVLVRVKVRRDYYSVIEFASCQSLLSFLTVNYTVEFHKYLQNHANY